MPPKVKPKIHKKTDHTSSKRKPPFKPSLPRIAQDHVLSFDMHLIQNSLIYKKLSSDLLRIVDSERHKEYISIIHSILQKMSENNDPTGVLDYYDVEFESELKKQNVPFSLKTLHQILSCVNKSTPRLGTKVSLYMFKKEKLKEEIQKKTKTG
jgi:hypothetical protein